MWKGGTHHGAAAAVRRFWIGGLSVDSLADYYGVVINGDVILPRERRRRMYGGRLMDINFQPCFFSFAAGLGERRRGAKELMARTREY